MAGSYLIEGLFAAVTGVWGDSAELQGKADVGRFVCFERHRIGVLLQVSHAARQSVGQPHVGKGGIRIGRGKAKGAGPAGSTVQAQGYLSAYRCSSHPVQVGRTRAGGIKLRQFGIERCPMQAVAAKVEAHVLGGFGTGLQCHHIALARAVGEAQTRTGHSCIGGARVVRQGESEHFGRLQRSCLGEEGMGRREGTFGGSLPGRP